MLCKTHTSISEFRLRLPRLPQICPVNSWVAALLNHNVNVIEIGEDPEREVFDIPVPRYLPRDLFMSASLVDLKLCVADKLVLLKLPELVLLPNLKVLHLENLVFLYQSTYFRFDQRRFPLLEHLSLSHVRFRCSEDDGTFFGLRIRSPTLKVLEILVNDDPTVMSIDVETPCLEHFDYEAFSPVKLCLSESENLVKAYMYDHFNPGHDFHSGLMRVLKSVQVLALTGFNKDLGYSLPQFPNLKHLSFIDTGYESMWSMLQNAPNLEELQYRMSRDNVEFVPPNDVPLCLARSLKQIRLENFAASAGYIELDIEFVGYALQHGKMLEKVTLVQPKYVGPKVSRGLLMLPRCSAECVIELDLEYEYFVEE